VPAAANPLTSSPVSPGAGAGAGDAGAAGINPLWQTPAEVPEAAPEPDRCGPAPWHGRMRAPQPTLSALSSGRGFVEPALARAAPCYLLLPRLWTGALSASPTAQGRQGQARGGAQGAGDPAQHPHVAQEAGPVGEDGAPAARGGRDDPVHDPRQQGRKDPGAGARLLAPRSPTLAS